MAATNNYKTLYATLKELISISMLTVVYGAKLCENHSASWIDSI